MADTPLAQLDPDAQQALAELGDSLADLGPDDRQAVAELAQARADGDVSRRQLLKAAGAIGAGALVGGGSAAALTGSAAADASTSDSDPDVGTPSNRADIWAAGVDANVIDADDINDTLNAAEYSGSDADGILAAINDGGPGTRVHMPAGGGSGPNGEYILRPNNNGYAIAPSFDGITLTGDGDGTVLKCEDGAPQFFRALLSPEDEWTMRDFVLDGNRSNQSDGGGRLRQLGIFAGESDDWYFENITVRNTQYGPIRSRGGQNHTLLGCTFKGHGGGIRWDVSGGGREAKDITLVAPEVDGGSGLSSDGLYDGLIFGNACNESTIVAPKIEGCDGDSLLVEACSDVSISGGVIKNSSNDACFRTASGTNSLDVSGLVCRGGGADLANLRESSVELTVRESSGKGVIMGDVNEATKVDVTVIEAGDVPVEIGGASAGASVDVTINRCSVSTAAVILQNGPNGSDCSGVRVTGTVSGNGNLTYAVQAADSNQTGLVDALTAEGMATGTVDNPGGLTVGDVL